MLRAVWLVTLVIRFPQGASPPGRVSLAAQEPQSAGRFVTSP